jgi:hypothetical protein
MISPPQIVHYGPTQDQPYIWIALVITIVGATFGLYKMRLNTLK